MKKSIGLSREDAGERRGDGATERHRVASKVKRKVTSQVGRRREWTEGGRRRRWRRSRC